MFNFNAYSLYYDLLYHDKDYKAESNYVARLIRFYKPGVQSILELGCGSGSHAQQLCAENFVVTGIDRSPEMVQIGNNKNIEGFTSLQGDISTFQLSKKFDCAISLFHVISYLTDNENLIGCFKRTHDHLNNGGLFIFDIWYSPAVYLQKPETRIKRIENEQIKVTRIAQSTLHTDKNVVDVNFEVHIQSKKSRITEILKETHPMRHFSIPEMELIASHTGFNIIKTEEFLTANHPDGSTWGVCFILQKQS